jgi:hypothetical protein
VSDPAILLIHQPASTIQTNTHYVIQFVPSNSEATKWLVGGRAVGTNGEITFRRVSIFGYDQGPFLGIDTTGRHSLGGAGGTTPDPSPTIKKYTGTYTMDWDQVYTSSGKKEVARLLQSVGNQSVLRMPNAARTLMMGATKVNAYLRLHHTGPYTSGGTAKIGRHTSSATAAPASAPAVVGEHLVPFVRGEVKESLLPSAWDAAFIAGTYYGFTLGHTTAPGVNLMEFSRRTTDITVRPQLRLEVWK